MKIEQRSSGKIGGGKVGLAPEKHISVKAAGNDVALNPKNPKFMSPREYDRVHLGENVIVFEPGEDGDRKK